MNKSAARYSPARLTVISAMVAPMPSKTRAVRLSASGVPNGSWRVWRSTASQRRHTARAAGGIAGTTWSKPQSWHSRSRAGLSGDTAVGVEAAGTIMEDSADYLGMAARSSPAPRRAGTHP